MKIRDSQWHRWFAWYPVPLDYKFEGNPIAQVLKRRRAWAWLRVVYRKQYGQRLPEGPWYCYSLPKRGDT